MSLERRFSLAQDAASVQVADTPDGRRIVHHAAPWGVLSRPLFKVRRRGRALPVRERFERGAFGELVRGDVMALFNHDPSRILGRTPGTLELEEDEIGLRYELDPPDTPTGREVLTLIDRGDLRGSSFAFAVAEGGEVWEERDGEILRTVRRASRLADVGPVTSPQYPLDGLAARAADGDVDAARASLETWLCLPRRPRLDAMRRAQADAERWAG